MKKSPSIARKRQAYRRALCGELKIPNADGQVILADLRKFAQIDNGGIVVSPVTRTTDSHATCYRAGLRDMYLRIARMLGLDEADVFDTTEETPDESAKT